MSRNLSIYLDFLRLTAALAVLIAHAQGYILPVIPNLIAAHADEGVAVFFVLSGFVIRYVLVSKETRWQSYVLARASRIFSVVLIALVATYIIDMIGLLINPGLYHSIIFFNDNYFSALIRALTFTNELWLHQSVFGSNQAYWSLGFEVPYYVLLGLVFFLPLRLAPFAVLAWAAVFGPRILCFLPLWLLGALTFDLVASGALRTRKAGVAIFILSILSYFVMRFAFNDYKLPITSWPKPEDLAFSFLYYFGIACVASANIFGFSRLFIKGDWSALRNASIIRWLAGGSFTLYIVHQPLLTLTEAIFPSIGAHPALGFTALLAIVLICYALAELGERRKNFYKKAILNIVAFLRSLAQKGKLPISHR